MATAINFRDLSAEHIHHIVEVGWQAEGLAGLPYRASVCGSLTSITHDVDTTRVTIAAGTHDGHIDLLQEDAEVTIVI